MSKAPLILLACLVVGCGNDNRSVERKLDELTKKVDALARQAAPKPPPRKQRPQPNPKDVYAVPVDGDPAIGPADALVTIVKGYEYACPYCEKVRPTIDQLLKQYDGKIRVVAKQFVVHPDVATTPSLAICAAARQGKFAEMDALLWDKAFATRTFDEATMKSLAAELHLDAARFDADMKGDCQAFIQKDRAELAAVGQGGTPCFFINGRYVHGGPSLAAFQSIIDEELARAQERVAQGTAPSAYYRTWVLEKGLPKFVPPAGS
jgi:protein-disulfide isomerase